MKTKIALTLITSGLLILLIFELDRFANNHSPATAEEDHLFSLRVEVLHEEDVFRLTSLHGFNFLEDIRGSSGLNIKINHLSLPLKGRHLITNKNIRPSALLATMEEDAHLEDTVFAFWMVYDDQEIILESIHGTKWERLSLSCRAALGPKCDARVTDSGIGFYQLQ
ncbi:hypothetical protein CYPRO_2556 [Cyclonatronum proteinivorum]|uniref:Uncharacterized protein n=1 Tax=Cyclonatronum proteinivorum TaxID=1457365 RepID=A0A345UMU6_9BACT|nr:hypothetical protein [Cyclonatronum proteinivorum]AXJ01798.1 hypothetical protein CYPRO_2556 [Cyclonatronum proteinivorum]